MGEVRSGKVSRGKSYPSLPDFITIPAWSRGAAPWCELSPMILGPIQVFDPLPVRPGFSITADGKYAETICNIFENYWQGSKIYNADILDPANPLTIDNIKPAFWIRRARIFASAQPVRRALPKAAYGYPIAGYYRGEIMDYVTSRNKVYAPTYYMLISTHPIFLQLCQLHKQGKKMIMAGPDGHNEHDPLTEAILDLMINDPTRIFGHELVLCAALLGKKYEY